MGWGGCCVAGLYSGHAGWHRWWWNETRSRCRFMLLSRVSVCVSVSPTHFSFDSLGIYITVTMARHTHTWRGEPCISRARLSEVLCYQIKPCCYLCANYNIGPFRGIQMWIIFIHYICHVITGFFLLVSFVFLQIALGSSPPCPTHLRTSRHSPGWPPLPCRPHPARKEHPVTAPTPPPRVSKPDLFGKTLQRLNNSHAWLLIMTAIL